MTTPLTEDTRLEHILSENFYWKMVNNVKTVHLDHKKAKAQLKQLLVEARLDELQKGGYQFDSYYGRERYSQLKAEKEKIDD